MTTDNANRVEIDGKNLIDTGDGIFAEVKDNQTTLYKVGDNGVLEQVFANDNTPTVHREVVNGETLYTRGDGIYVDANDNVFSMEDSSDANQTGAASNLMPSPDDLASGGYNTGTSNVNNPDGWFVDFNNSNTENTFDSNSNGSFFENVNINGKEYLAYDSENGKRYIDASDSNNIYELDANGELKQVDNNINSNEGYINTDTSGWDLSTSNWYDATSGVNATENSTESNNFNNSNGMIAFDDTTSPNEENNAYEDGNNQSVPISFDFLNNESSETSSTQEASSEVRDISFSYDDTGIVASNSDGQSIHFEKDAFINCILQLNISIEYIDKVLSNLTNYDSSIEGIHPFYERMHAGGFKVLSTDLANDISDNRLKIIELKEKAEAVIKEIGWFDEYDRLLQINSTISTEDNSIGDYSTYRPPNYTTNQEDLPSPPHDEPVDPVTPPNGETPPEETPTEETQTEETVTPTQEQTETTTSEEENKTEETVTPNQEEVQTLTEEERAAADKAQYTETVVNKLEEIISTLVEENPNEFTEIAIITTSTTGEMTSALIDLTDSDSLKTTLDSIKERGIEVGSTISILAYGGSKGAMYYGEITSLTDSDGKILLDKVQVNGTMIKTPQEENLNDEEKLKGPEIEFINKENQNIDITVKDNSSYISDGSVGNLVDSSTVSSNTPQFDTTIDPTTASQEPVYTFESMTPVVENPDELTIMPGPSQDIINSDLSSTPVSNNDIQTIDITPLSEIATANDVNVSLDASANASNNSLGGVLVGAASIAAGASALANTLKKDDEEDNKNAKSSANTTLNNSANVEYSNSQNTNNSSKINFINNSNEKDDIQNISYTTAANSQTNSLERLEDLSDNDPNITFHTKLNESDNTNSNALDNSKTINSESSSTTDSIYTFESMPPIVENPNVIKDEKLNASLESNSSNVNNNINAALLGATGVAAGAAMYNSLKKANDEEDNKEESHE